MNIRCPKCQTVFRVDPERIPASGVRAKCARCGDVFVVKRPATTQQATPSSPVARVPVHAGAGESTPVTSRPAHFARPPAGGVPVGSVASSSVATSRDSGSPVAKAGSAASAKVVGARTRAPRDPRAKAERLARALISDIVAYHPERRDRSLETGNLRTEFREEILKSWEEYVAQVGLDLAKSTPFFREALNTILAKGQKIF